MSRENVELVIRAHPAPDVDMARLFRDDEMWSKVAEAIAPLFHPDFETVPPGVPGTERVHVGLEGLRTAWLGWMEPWLTYRTEIQQTLDAGDRVLVLVHDYGRRDQDGEEVKVDGSGVWTVKAGKIARTEFFAFRLEAFEAAGLSDSTA
jgi:ketosteroid isomerase-like protein